MNRSILKPIALGILFGALAFMMPFFLLKAVFFILLIGLLFRMFGWGRWGGYHRGWGPSYADRIRSMSDEEYAAFKTRNQYGCGWDDRNPSQTAEVKVNK